MTRLYISVSGLILYMAISCFFSPALSAQSVRPVLTDNKLKTKLDELVDLAARNYLQDSNTHGVSIGVYHKSKYYTYNYGKGRVATANDFYNIGSVAKTFVATILAQAVMDKKVDLNDDIRRFLPGQYSNLEFNGKPVSIVHLANHTSGLPGTFRVFSPSIQDSLRKLSISAQVDFFARYNKDSLLSDLYHARPDTIPGTKYRYNSSAMMVLILLLENIYQKPYEDIVAGYLKKRLKMNNTRPFLTPSEMSRAVQGYNNNGRPLPFLNLRGFYIGPTMNSTINDMLKFIKANLAMNDRAMRLTHQLTYGSERGFGVGLGWMMNNKRSGHRYIYHDGNTKIGYNTLCTLYPDEDLGCIIIVNDTVNADRVNELENDLEKAFGKQ